MRKDFFGPRLIGRAGNKKTFAGFRRKTEADKFRIIWINSGSFGIKTNFLVVAQFFYKCLDGIVSLDCLVIMRAIMDILVYPYNCVRYFFNYFFNSFTGSLFFDLHCLDDISKKICLYSLRGRLEGTELITQKSFTKGFEFEFGKCIF